MRRPSKHQYYMNLAREASTRATCDRAHVGCVLVRFSKRGDSIVATGYNGAPSGHPHCDEVGHDMENGHCVRAVHAERNAIYQCARIGVSADGAVAYCTVMPCVKCTEALHSAGVRLVYFEQLYKSMSDDDVSRIRLYVKAGMDFCYLVDGEVVDATPRVWISLNRIRPRTEVEESSLFLLNL